MSYFSEIKDPRVERTKAHQLYDILFITIAAVICGAESWNDIEEYGKAKEEWLRKHLKLTNGIPSHDTFNRVMSILSPDELEICFRNWIKDNTQQQQGDVISLDGKSVRGSAGTSPHSFIHMVSAWSQNNGITLGQIKVEAKSNEITAIPKLLDVIEIEGSIITIDAMGCQKNIAKKIIEKKANYILAVKENQKELCENIRESIRMLKPDDKWEEVDAGHGRVETRTCYIYNDLSMVRREWDWCELRQLVEIKSIRYHKKDGKEERETRYYISSLEGTAETIGKAIRSHWGIENSLHWVLDVSFGEDKSRKRDRNAAENYSRLLRIALSVLKNDGNKKRSIKGKRLDAAWNNNYLAKLLLC